MSSVANVMNDAPVFQQVIRYDIGFGIQGDGAAQIAVEIIWPEKPSKKQVFFCVPGGAMNRRYFDLGGAASRFSFARQMAARGFVSVLIDSPGIGGSDRPEDGYTLTPRLIAELLGKTQARVADDLRAGRVSAALPAMPDMQSLGIGHSMGAMLTVLQQFYAPAHDALVLLGFGTRGLPQFLPAEARALLDDPAALREALPRLARKAFAQSYPVMPSNGGEAGLFGSTHAEPDAVQALKAANDVLLPVPATLSMFPGNIAPECAAIQVPVYLGIGERDMVGEPDKVPESFASSPDVRLQLLPKTGHSHFLFAARDQLFDGLAEWVNEIKTGSAG